MLRTLMSATALTALVAASSAFGQAQQGPTSDPLVDTPPAATEPAPGMEPEPMAPAPETFAPDAMDPQAGAEELPAPMEEAAPPAEQAAGPNDIFIPQQGPGELLASSLIGSTVQSPAGESLGNVNDVVFTDEGSVDGVVIGVGGFLGIGQKNVAVAFDAIDKATADDGNVQLTLNATQEQLESAPQYITVAGLRQQEEIDRQLPSQEPAAPVPSQ